MNRRTTFSLVLVLLGAAACSAPQDTGGTDLDTNFAAQLASSWHWTGDPQRVQVGIFGSDSAGMRVVTGGAVELSFSFLGSDGGSEPEPGPSATAEYVPVPGTSRGGDEPALPRVTGASTTRRAWCSTSPAYGGPR